MPPRALALREGKAPVRDRLLTMLFLPALYVTWFRIKEPEEQQKEVPERAGALALRSAAPLRHC